MDESEPKPKHSRRGKGKRWGGVGSILKLNFQMFPGHPIFEKKGRPAWRTISGDKPPTIEREVTAEWLGQLQTALVNLRSQPERALRAELKEPEEWLKRMDFLLSQLRAALKLQQDWETGNWLEADLIPQRRAKKFKLFREKFPLAWRAAEDLRWVSFTSRESIPDDLED